MLTIDFLDETEQASREDFALIRSLIEHAARELGVDAGAEVSVTLTDDEAIRALNRDYRDKDAATDVLSFAMREGEDGLSVAGEPAVLGDIIISRERARAQAKEYGHSERRELGFLALHGFLHLLGYDHMTEQEEALMFGKQAQLLASFGLPRDA